MDKLRKFIKECRSYSYKNNLFGKRWVQCYDIVTCIRVSLIENKDDKLFIEMLTNLEVSIDKASKMGKAMPWKAFKILMKPILIIEKKYKK